MSWDIGFELNGYRFKDMAWNYTHNCNDMMRQAGYDWIYNLDGMKVIDTLPRFEQMLIKLKATPDKFVIMNPDNGWGDYNGLVKMWEKEILPAARKIVESIPEVTWWEWS